MTRPEITGVAGVPECVLSPSLVARLPVDVPPAPWTGRCEAVVWVGRGGRAARAALPPALRRTSRALAVVGALVRYSDTPVGTYDEVLAMVVTHPGRPSTGTVAFMAVDSEASLVGGRSSWAVPKTMAAFDGEVGDGRRLTAGAADLGRWRVSAVPRTLGPAGPVAVRGRVRQVFPDGRVGASPLTARGRLAAALVTVEVDSEGPLPAWLRPGRHAGALLRSVTFTLQGPTFG